MLAGIAALAARDADQPADALDAEQWASTILGMLHAAPIPPGEDVEATFLPAFVAALKELGTRKALATLRALAAVIAPAHAAAAHAAADRLAGTGLRQPAWAADLGTAQATAALMCEEAFDDGVSVMVEFTAPNIETHTMGIYIDHNMGGLVKDVFLAGPLREVRAQLRRNAPDQVGVAIGDLELDEARARVQAALDILDHTWDPPVNEDVRPTRALIEARMRLLPDGFEWPDDDIEVKPAQHEALLEDFLSSPEGQRWCGDEDAEEIALLAIDFGASYNYGGPLHWSPVVVEIFMISWLARQVTREPGFFERVPVVLCDWVRYAGRRRRVPAAPLREAVAAVKACREEMLDAVNDPGAWGPAKSFAVAALDAGVDMSDPDQLQRFIDHYNDGLAA